MNRVKRKSIKLVSLILLALFSLTILDVASPGSTRLFVDPPEIRDDTLQAGSAFTVDLNVSDVTDLYGWQVNMSWDSSMVEVKWHKSYSDRSGEHVGHGNGTQTVFQLDRKPVEENTETIYVFVTNESLGHGNDVTTTFWLDHTPAQDESETIYVPVTGENVGTGDGSTTDFALDNVPVREESEIIYVSGVNLTRYLNYTIDYPSGHITFMEPPANGAPITADYEWLHGERDVDYTIDYTTGNVTFTDPPVTCTDLTVDYIWLNYTRNVHYTINYTTGEITFAVAPPNCTDIGADYTWWTPIYHTFEGAFLKGPFQFDTHPYQHATLPYSEQTETATTSSTTQTGWTTYPLHMPAYTIPEALDASDGIYAQAQTDNAEEVLGSFGFVTGSMSFVAQLEVTVESSTTQTDPLEQDKIEIQVTGDNGGSWGPIHTVDVFYTEYNRTVDVTDDFAWTPSMLSDANFKVSMRYRKFGATTTRIRVNSLRVRAVDSLAVADPEDAYDVSYDTYASFGYNQTGNFTVYDFSHDFPSGVPFPAQEYSTIVQVDFNMKYSASAAVDDEYKIAYYVYPSQTETVLVDWTSSSVSLGNYTWADQSEPNGFGWTWVDVSNTRIVVETKVNSGADSDALFREYEAWLTIWYERPTTKVNKVENAKGYCLLSVITNGDYPGQSGNGTLGTIEFEVLDYGETNLTITDPVRTYLLDPDQAYIAHTTEDGYFTNRIPGDIQGDTSGTPPDGDVDMFDFFAFADHYATDAGDPNYNILADLQGDTSESYPFPDGDVDMFDFFAFADNYTKEI